MVVSRRPTRCLFSSFGHEGSQQDYPGRALTPRKITSNADADEDHRKVSNCSFQIVLLCLLGGAKAGPDQANNIQLLYRSDLGRQWEDKLCCIHP